MIRLDRRITYATIALELSEEPKPEMDLGTLPLSAQLRNAFVEGWQSAFSGALEAVLAVVRVAPTLMLWALMLAVPAWLLRRRLARQ